MSDTGKLARLDEYNRNFVVHILLSFFRFKVYLLKADTVAKVIALFDRIGLRYFHNIGYRKRMSLKSGRTVNIEFLIDLLQALTGNLTVKYAVVYTAPYSAAGSSYRVFIIGKAVAAVISVHIDLIDFNFHRTCSFRFSFRISFFR